MGGRGWGAGEVGRWSVGQDGEVRQQAAVRDFCIDVVWEDIAWGSTARRAVRRRRCLDAYEKWRGISSKHFVVTPEHG